MSFHVYILIFFCFLCSGCRKAPRAPAECKIPVHSGGALEIIPNTYPPEKALNLFCKKCSVFGIGLYATDKVSDEKLLHSAAIMAQYLDNDEDGVVDDKQVLQAMLQNNAAMIIVNRKRTLRRFMRASDGSNAMYQDLLNDEIFPDNSEFDATLEEVLHLVTVAGYASAYPSVFGTESGSELCKAMDAARGGHFQNVPDHYPDNAWFHYDDATCGYSCMATEYFYWALSSYLGLQAMRCNEIANEWECCTREKLRKTDPTIYALITDTTYHLPTVAPDACYLP